MEEMHDLMLSQGEFSPARPHRQGAARQGAVEPSWQCLREAVRPERGTAPPNTNRAAHSDANRNAAHQGLAGRQGSRSSGGAQGRGGRGRNGSSSYGGGSERG